MHPTLRSHAREVFAVQLYINNARALFPCILSILNSDWLQHARYVSRVYELQLPNETYPIPGYCQKNKFDCFFKYLKKDKLQEYNEKFELYKAKKL